MPFVQGYWRAGRATSGLSRRPRRVRAAALFALLVGAITVAVGAGCRRHAEKVGNPPNPSPTSAPVATTAPVATMAQGATVRGVDPVNRTFANAAGGVRLSYPPGWRPTPSNDFILMLLPADGGAAASRSTNDGATRGATTLPWGERFISLDMPDLPPHVPGFLPLNMVRDGYVDDVRKYARDCLVQTLAPPQVGAKAALVRTAWPRSSPAYVETALIMTRGDHVYILRARSRAADEPATRAAFDQIVQSLRFGK